MKKSNIVWTTALSALLAMPTVAASQANNAGDTALAVGLALGGAVQSLNRANATKQWSALSPEMLYCVRRSIGRNNIELEKVAAAGIGPGNKQVKPLVDECVTLTSQVLRAGFPCQVTNIVGGGTTSICDQAYFLEQNGQNVKLTTEQYLEGVFTGKKVSVKSFEQQAAKSERLAIEENARRITHQKAIEDQRLASAKRAEEQRLAAEKAAEERRRFLATPEGKKQLADQAARQRQIEAKRVADETRIARDYPFTLVLTCSVGSGFDNQAVIETCLSGNIGGSIELRNGSSYGLYRVNSVPSDWRRTQRGTEVRLARNFSLIAKNGSENLILGTRVFDSSGKVLFQKLTSRFGTITVSN